MSILNKDTINALIAEAEGNGLTVHHKTVVIPADFADEINTCLNSDSSTICEKYDVKLGDRVPSLAFHSEFNNGVCMDVNIWTREQGSPWAECVLSAPSGEQIAAEKIAKNGNICGIHKVDVSGKRHLVATQDMTLPLAYRNDPPKERYLVEIIAREIDSQSRVISPNLDKDDRYRGSISEMVQNANDACEALPKDPQIPEREMEF